MPQFAALREYKVINSCKIVTWHLSQGMLGTQDLGQVYFEPIKDKHGNALLVLLKDMNVCSNLDGVRWTQLCKLQLQRKSISSPEEPTALDMLLITLHVSPECMNAGSSLKELVWCCRQAASTAVGNGRRVSQQWLWVLSCHSLQFFCSSGIS